MVLISIVKAVQDVRGFFPHHSVEYL